MDLALSDPPCDARKECRMNNSLHESFTAEEVSNFVEFLRQVLTLRAHEHLFCSRIQFPECYKNLESMQEEGPNSEAISKVEVTMKSREFEVEFFLLHHTRALGYYLNER